MLKKYAWLWILLLAFGIFAGRHYYQQARYTNGVEAPEISGQLADGQRFMLSALRGQYVLLDFWGSWCGPCRQQNPAIRQLYQTFQSANFEDGKGFNVVSVAIEKDTASWQRAIIADRLDWPYHLMDQSSSLRFFDGPLAKAYGITRVPTTYLIDPKGMIIGVDLDAPTTQRLLRQRLTE